MSLLGKKKRYILLIIALFVTIITSCTLCLMSWNVKRYMISEPMADLDYKMSILKDSHNITYTLEALRPIMGKEELAELITKNDDNPQVYTPSKENIDKGIFRINLHMHTTMSDGEPTVEYRLNKAQEYAQKHIKDGYMVIAITDHNTVWGAKEVVKVLEKNKGKYKNIKIVPGMEIFSRYLDSKYSKVPVQIHVLTWCINPYDKFLNKEFYKKYKNDPWNRTFPDRKFDWVIQTMSNYGIVGPAHPARYTTYMKENKYPYITEMFERYAKLNKGVKFTEGYYQSYMVTSTGEHLGDEYDKYINHINNEAKRLNIIRTGSTDSHGKSLFIYR